MKMIFSLTSDQALDYVNDNTMIIVVDTNKPQMTECPELFASIPYDRSTGSSPSGQHDH